MCFTSRQTFSAPNLTTRAVSGFALRLGYAFNEHLRQVWSYSLVDRDVFNVEAGASPFIF